MATIAVMDGAKLEQLLQTERHIRRCAETVARQGKLVRNLEERGLDFTEAKRRLDVFQQIQLLHMEECDRLLAELGLPD